MKNVNMILRNLRIAHGLTQEELAEKIGMSVTSYGKIERGETRLNSEHIRLIAAALGETPEMVMIGYHPRQESDAELRESEFFEQRLKTLRNEKDAEIDRLRKELDTALTTISDLRDNIASLKQINRMQERDLEKAGLR